MAVTFGIIARGKNRKTGFTGCKEYFDPELPRELNKAGYPIHFLDFETLGPARPLYPQTRPYQTIPFQWSDHVLSRDGSLTHREYLCLETRDPREEFTNTLLEILGIKGTIMIYTSYEVEIIQGLAEHLPRYLDRLLAAIGRMMDLPALIQRYYYHPKFRGSFSLMNEIEEEVLLRGAQFRAAPVPLEEFSCRLKSIIARKQTRFGKLNS